MPTYSQYSYNPFSYRSQYHRASMTPATPLPFPFAQAQTATQVATTQVDTTPITSFSTANWLNGSTAVASIGIQLAGTLYSNHSSKKIANAQARIAQAQAQVQANQYAAEGIGYEITASRIQQAYGYQEYETIRQQKAYIEDMKLDTAARGVEREGTAEYMIQAQQAEFDRSNYYADLQNTREQANYMLAANQSYLNAQSAIEGGRLYASAIKSQSNYQNTANWINFASGTLNTAASWYWRNYQINNTAGYLHG